MRIVDIILDDETDTSEREIVEFGTKQLIVIFVGMIVAVLVAVSTKEIVRTLILLLCMIPLRQNAGGFHLKSRKNCTVVSTFILIGMVMIIKYVTISPILSIVLWVISSVPIVLFAPIGNTNRELDEIEVKVYGRRTKIIWIAESMLFLFLMLMKSSDWYIIILISVVLTGLLVFIEYIRERAYIRNHSKCN